MSIKQQTTSQNWDSVFIDNLTGWQIKYKALTEHGMAVLRSHWRKNLEKIPNDDRNKWQCLKHSDRLDGKVRAECFNVKPLLDSFHSKTLAVLFTVALKTPIQKQDELLISQLQLTSKTFVSDRTRRESRRTQS